MKFFDIFKKKQSLEDTAKELALLPPAERQDKLSEVKENKNELVEAVKGELMEIAEERENLIDTLKGKYTVESVIASILTGEKIAAIQIKSPKIGITQCIGISKKMKILPLKG